MRKENLTVVIGSTGSGKTHTLINMTEAKLVNDERVLYLSEKPIKINEKATLVVVDYTSKLEDIVSKELMAKRDEIKENYDTIVLDLSMYQPFVTEEGLEMLKSLVEEDGLYVILSIQGKPKLPESLDSPIFRLSDLVIITGSGSNSILNFPDY